MNLEAVCNFFKRYWGVVCALLCGTSIAFTQAISKELVKRNSTGIIIILRSLFQTVFSGIILAATERSLCPDRLDAIYVIGRCIFDSVTAFLVCASLKYVPLFDQMTLFYGTLTIVVAMIASIVLKEKIDVLTAITIVIMVVGIVTLAQPSFIFRKVGLKLPPSYHIGVIMCVTGGILQSFSMICVRKIQNTGVNQASFHVNWTSTIVNFVPFFAYKDFRIPRLATDYVLIILAASLVIVLYKYELDGLKVTDATTFQLITLVQLPITLSINYLWFADDLNYLEGAGATIIIISLILFISKEHIVEKIRECLLTSHGNTDEERIILQRSP